jgi:hypothetical protein
MTDRVALSDLLIGVHSIDIQDLVRPPSLKLTLSRRRTLPL